MRRTSQSMYQSTYKAPLATSKMIDGSNLFKSSGAIPGNSYLMQCNRPKRSKGRTSCVRAKGLERISNKQLIIWKASPTRKFLRRSTSMVSNNKLSTSSTNWNCWKTKNSLKEKESMNWIIFWKTKSPSMRIFWQWKTNTTTQRMPLSKSTKRQTRRLRKLRKFSKSKNMKFKSFIVSLKPIENKWVIERQSSRKNSLNWWKNSHWLKMNKSFCLKATKKNNNK